MSYAILIVNDPLRLVASQLRVGGVDDGLWWTFLIAVYVPVSVLLAWPLARVLGLMPRGPARPKREELMVQREERLRSLSASQA
jgi:hypothetical protein